MSDINDMLWDVITEPGEVLSDEGLYSEGIAADPSSDSDDQGCDMDTDPD